MSHSISGLGFPVGLKAFRYKIVKDFSKTRLFFLCAVPFFAFFAVFHVPPSSVRLTLCLVCPTRVDGNRFCLVLDRLRFFPFTADTLGKLVDNSWEIQGGGPSFGNLDESPPSSLGEGVDVLKLQVAVNCRDRSRNSILGMCIRL